ncbi:MAG: hypothetical protein IJD82_02535 [Clostridia bacterium]|nr:hypothetical protein [Clostridia bacterium]
MRLTDPQSEPYPITFQTTHTFISAPGDSLPTVASRFLADLQAGGHTVYVTDPYLFPRFSDPSQEPQYETDVKAVLEGIGASKIVFCAPEKKNATLYSNVESYLDSKGIALVFDQRLTDCHDRFWYCPETEKCVSFGTSLNGIGKKICRIDMLAQDEVAAIKQRLQAVGVMQADDPEEQ